MRLTSLLRGAQFGQLAKIHGIVVWKISPFEQRAFPNFFSQAVPNTLRRIRASVPYILPQFIIGYLIFELAERRYKQLQRKDPKEFENDQ